MSRLDEAFVQVDKVHRDDNFEDDFQFLTLEALGSGRWAATFDYLLGNTEWFEKHEIHKYPTASIAATPEDAILGAVEKFWNLTANVTTAAKREVGSE